MRSSWIANGRIDLSEWVIHFIHRRGYEHSPDPFSWPSPPCTKPVTDQEALELADICQAESDGLIPTHFDPKGPKYSDYDEDVPAVVEG